MSELYDKKNESSPTYKLHRKETLIWIGVTTVVLVLSYFFIWGMHNNSVQKIENRLELAQANVDESSKAYQKIKAYEQVAKTDPIGFDLANFVHENYHTVVTVVYFILTALTLATVARFIAFILITMNRKKYYPSDKTLEKFVKDRPRNWNQFYIKVKDMRHFGCAFWKVLKQSASVINDSKKYDHLYLHMRNRFDKVIENINETSLYDSISTTSPAAGFFGTLIGLLFIFTQSENGVSGLTNSPEFAVGMKVAVISSLWGLLNLGAAILFSYFTRQITERIYDRMILKAFAVCNLVERYDTDQNEDDKKKEKPEVMSRGPVNVS